MANPEHLKILKQGVDEWNRWREENRRIKPDLSRARLRNVKLNNANFVGADLRGAGLSGSQLYYAYFNVANLTGTDFSRAHLIGSNLNRTNLSNANLNRAHLVYASLDESILDNADFTNAWVGNTSFGSNNLSRVKGLETVSHVFPSSIGINTIYKSQANIPEEFLRGCGVPEDFITYMRSLVVRPIQFYSCFISYSTKDEEFARRLYSRMRDEQLRVWFAPEEMKGGEKLHEQIDRAIQVHDKLLLILSEHSMESEWVMTEVRRARRSEAAENRRKLFPISVVDFERIKTWERFDADTGRDLAREVREYFIPDFSNWKEHDAFEDAFGRLLRDLKAEDEKGGGG